MQYVAILAATLTMASLHAETLLLRGTVGKYPVVMKLANADGQVSGSYFYEKYKQDIPLRGQLNGQGYVLSSSIYGNDDKDVDHLELTRAEDGIKGAFTSGSGKQLPVDLHVIPSGAVPEPKPGLHFSRGLDDYEKLQLANLTFAPGKTETVGGKYVIQWYTESRSKVSMFRVVSGYPAPVIASINNVIDSDFYENLSGYFGCSDETGKPGTDTLQVSDRYLDDRFVSYAVSNSWFCAGAAHPDFALGGTTIDAKTGKRLTQEDVYWLGIGSKPAPNSDAWMKYRDAVFGPAVVKLLKRLYPKEMMPVGDDNGCNYADPDVWKFGSWRLAEKGMYVGAYFARAEKACDNPEWSFIPYGELKKNNPALFGG
ncbi:hypothetical protein [Dyella japonica]|uniref:Uncharacterized protein n=1 Tax=Dyella japonica A8 TaxID=1217721 RepID=A0A075JZT3_9GAMM|nr:hypothetical protein [Dyella japonica]AIF47075.1 hypothetical protein HY57_07225 [Dyella japonica A8]